jgi:hypothetical protein
MTSRHAATSFKWLQAGVRIAFTTGLALAARAAQPDSGATSHPVTATPPLQVIPATPVTTNVQQRMRNCNAAADARKLSAAAHEAFLKTCMAPHHSHTVSRPGSQPQAGSQPKAHP